MSDPKPQPEPAMEEILATIRRIIAEDESGTAPTPARAPVASGDILELTDAIEADGSMRHMAPFGSPRRNLDENRVSPLPDGRIEPAPPSSSAAAEPTGRQQDQGPSAGPIEGAGEREPMVLGAAAAQAATPSSAAQDTLGADERSHVGGDRALENLVREMLQPMLQRWLDENLPGLVEQAVRAEAARVADDTAAPRRVTRARPKAKPD